MFKKIESQAFPNQNSVSQEKSQEGRSVQGRQWVNAHDLKDRSKLKTMVQELRKIERDVFDQVGDDEQKIENEYDKLMNLRIELTTVNEAAHKYNNKWYIKILSCFFKNLKVQTLNPEIQALDEKVKEAQYIKSIALLLSKLNDRIKKHRQDDAAKKQAGQQLVVPDALFRVPGLESNAKKLAVEFIKNPEMDLREYSDDDMASGLKKIFRADTLPVGVLQRLQKAAIPQASLNEAAKAIQDLPPFEREFLLNLLDLLSNTFEHYWKPQVNGNFEVMLIAAPFLKVIFPNPSADLQPLLENYEALKNILKV